MPLVTPQLHSLLLLSFAYLSLTIYGKTLQGGIAHMRHLPVNGNLKLAPLHWCPSCLCCRGSHLLSAWGQSSWHLQNRIASCPNIAAALQTKAAFRQAHGWQYDPPSTPPFSPGQYRTLHAHAFHPACLGCVHMLSALQRQQFLEYMVANSNGVAGILLVSSSVALSYNVVHSMMIQRTSAVTTTVLGDLGREDACLAAGRIMNA